MDQSLTELIPRMLLSMGVVMGVMWVAAKALAKRTGSAPVKGKTAKGSKSFMAKRNTTTVPVQVLSRQGVGRHASVTVVRVGSKTMILGVTEQNVSLISELENVDTDETIELDNPESHWTGIPGDAADAGSSQAWTGLLSQIRERTVRRS